MFSYKFEYLLGIRHHVKLTMLFRSNVAIKLYGS